MDAYPFIGLAYENVLSAKAKGSIMDFNTQNYFNIAEPDLQGDSLISELGFKYLMQNLELYSALKAYTGKREGVSIKLRGFWKF